MTIPVRYFDPVGYKKSGRICSDSVENDPWVIFHGTSGFSSEAIEKHGFQFSSSAVPLNALQRVASIFGRIKWSGDNYGGYPVLKGFSLDYDYSSNVDSPVFFAETSQRALLYATEDFAGGEKLRALRIAFADLDAYTSDSELQTRHRNKMLKTFAQLTRMNASAETLTAARPVDIDLDFLRQEVVAVEDVRKLAECAWTKFDYGVVYAVRVTIDDIDKLCCSFMGIEARTLIQPTRIIEKVIIPSGTDINCWLGDGLDLLNRLDSGLLLALAQQASNQKASGSA
jgi:hypothetical protein